MFNLKVLLPGGPVNIIKMDKLATASVDYKEIGEDKMPDFRNMKFYKYLLAVATLFVLKGVPELSGQEKSALSALLPEVSGWTLSEAPQNYLPETLFQYIDGAAEIYLSYDFRELVVAQYKQEGSQATLTLEIYNMGNERNSFGIYSAERFPENKFIEVGLQGYSGEGELIFVAGENYIKLVCFDCGEGAEKELRSFADRVAAKISPLGAFPLTIGAFPKDGLIANSEKFVLRNFLGFDFLRNGFLASYKVNGQEFECFFIEGKNADEAKTMLDRYLDFFKKNNLEFESLASGYHLKDRYSRHIFLAQAGGFLCGVIRIKEGAEAVGEKYLGELVKSLNKR
jgi:hypothetical protein